MSVYRTGGFTLATYIYYELFLPLFGIKVVDVYTLGHVRTGGRKGEWTYIGGV